MPEEPKKDEPVSTEPVLEETVDTTEPTPAEPAAEATPDAAPAASEPAKTEPLASPAPSNLSQPSKLPKKTLLIGGIIAAALALLIGGSVAAYNVWYQNPEKVVYDALANAMSAKSATFTGSLKTLQDSNVYEVNVDGGVTKTELQVKVDVSIDAEDSSTIEVDGEFVYDKDSNMYIKVNKVRDILETVAGSSADMIDQYYGDILDDVDGEWIKVSKDDLDDLGAEYSKTQECIEDATKKLDTDNNVKKELEKVVKDNRFITIKKSLGSKDVNGVGSLGYLLDFDAEKAESFFKALSETTLGKDLKDCDESYDFSDVKASDFDSDSEGFSEVELWASRFGHQITEIKVNGGSDGNSGQLIFRPVINANVTIEVPTDSTPVKDIYESYLQATEELSNQYYSSMYDNYDYSSLYDDYDYSTY